MIVHCPDLCGSRSTDVLRWSAWSAPWPSRVGRDGVRVVALRHNAVPETREFAAANDVFAGLAEATALGRLLRPQEVANAAVYLPSARVSAMTGAVLNLACVD